MIPRSVLLKLNKPPHRSRYHLSILKKLRLLLLYHHFIDSNITRFLVERRRIICFLMPLHRAERCREGIPVMTLSALSDGLLNLAWHWDFVEHRREYCLVLCIYVLPYLPALATLSPALPLYVRTLISYEV
ncbi:hypothetical protein ACRALDRAFT_2023322 [Sodiomyces alcalophilus JCM 7366]|uniref:uncharacterized protein n=1 Tax=Sodiomyces alcalophilus JCM 7366 TaxID=591952 RepID=UPI0039B57D37